MDTKNLDTLRDLQAKASRRGMRISKAATKAGLDPVSAKSVSVADSIVFLTDEEKMVEAAKENGHSCMSAYPDAYRYWARATTSEEASLPVIRPVAVAVYGWSRCLVRLDTREFVKCYGEQAGELAQGLRFLGFKENVKALNDLSIPARIFAGFERKEEFGYEYKEELIEISAAPGFSLRIVEKRSPKPILIKKIKQYHPRPYSDGLRRNM